MLKGMNIRSKVQANVVKSIRIWGSVSNVYMPWFELDPINREFDIYAA